MLTELENSQHNHRDDREPEFGAKVPAGWEEGKAEEGANN